LFPDGPSGDYADPTSNVKVHLWSQNDLELQNSRSKAKRAAFNYHRCLTFDREHDALILEDDVVLTDNWANRIADCLVRIPERLFILVVWHTWDWAFPPFEDDIFRFMYPIVAYPNGYAFTMVWSGTPAVYYPRLLLQTDFPEVMFAKIPDQPDSEFYDMIIGRYCFDQNIPIYLMTPKAAEHIGNVSSLGNTKLPI